MYFVRSNRSCLIVVMVLMLLAGNSPLLMAASPTIYDFRLIQGHASLPAVTVYADIIGAGEIPVKGLQPADIKATVGAAPAKIKRLIPFEDSGEGIGYVLLVDVSKSLSAKQFALMKDTIAAFVDAMSDADQAALVAFGSEVKVAQEFTPNRSKIKEKLAGLGPTDQETAFYSGIDKGIAVARTGGNGVPLRRVVITMSDGVNDLTGGVSKGDIASRLTADPVPLFLIGFVQGQPTAEEESAIGVMKNFAKTSGGRYYDGRGGEWRGIYFAITRAIRSAFLIELDVPNFRSEGSVHELTMTVAAANRSWTEKIQLSIPAGGSVSTAAAQGKEAGGAQVDEAQSPGFPGGKPWLFAVIAALALAGAGIWLWRRRTKPQRLSKDRRSHAAAVQPVFSQSGAGATPAPGVLVRLMRVGRESPSDTIEIEISDRVVLGSDPGMSHLVLENDSGISPAHCEITFETGQLFVQDLATTEGTFLNGAALNARQVIEEGDLLRLGTAEFRITFPS